MNRLVEFLRDPAVIRDWNADAWNAFLPLVRSSRLTGRCLDRLDQLDLLRAVPPRIIDHLRGGDIQARYVRGQALREWSHVEPLLTRAGIDVVPLKGLAYVLQGLPPSRWRGLSDIDILVRRDDVQRAEHLLQAAGWTPSGVFDDYDRHYYAEWMHEVPPLTHRARKVEVDLHHNLSPPVSRIKIDAQMLWDASVMVDGADGRPLRVLAPVDLLLHNAVHLFMNDELRGGLRDVVDFRDLFEHFATADDAFPENLLRRAAGLGCGRPLYYAVLTAVRLGGLQVSMTFLDAVGRYAPTAPVNGTMSLLIDRLLAPHHPAARTAALAEHALFIRSHWVRMPPLMLIRHLGHKWLKRKAKDTAEPELPG